MVSAASFLAYIAFGVCLFYQQLHIRNYKGESRAFLSILFVFAISGTVTGISFLIFCFIKYFWWTPIVLLAAGLLSQMPATLLEIIVRPFYISLAGFVVMPVAACVMFVFA